MGETGKCKGQTRKEQHVFGLLLLDVNKRSFLMGSQNVRVGQPRVLKEEKLRTRSLFILQFFLRTILTKYIFLALQGDSVKVSEI